VDVIPCSGSDLAIAYRKYTGKRVIVASAAAGKEFSLFLDASPDDPISYEMAAELLKRAAGIEGFVFVDDPNIENLAYLTADARVTTKLYPVFNEGDELPETDKVVTYVMTFQHIKPETAQQVFQQIIGQTGNYGSVAITNTQVIITEHTSLIRGLIKLKEEIDIPGDVPRTRFINVKYADVTELAGVLNELLNNQQQAQNSAASRRTQGSQASAPPPAPGAPPGGAPTVTSARSGISGGTAANEETPIQIVPEPRTNRIFAMGRAVDLVFVEGLIREFDIETSEKTFLRRKLRFLAVAEFLPIAENALTRAFGAGEGGSTSTGGSGGSTTGGSSRTTGTTTSQRQTGGTSSRNNFGKGMNQFGSGGFGGMGGMSGMGGGGTSLGDPTVSTAPESLLVGRTLLVADNITNSIVVQGPPSGLEIVERLLDQLDVKADQVMISTVIGQLSLADNLEFGASYLFSSGDLISRVGGGIGNIVVPPGAGPNIGNGDFGFDKSESINSGGLRLYGTAGDFHILMRALATNDDFTVLARPSIFTANNMKGVISSGEQIAIPTNSNTYYQGGGNTQIQYVPVELRLEVIPLINSNDELTLQISLLSDEVSGSQTVAGAGPNGGDLTVPRVTTRELVTTVTVPNNETIVLGGLITTRTGEGVSGIPLLSDIPILGKLFSYTETQNERAELLVFIQPSIISSRGSLDANQRDSDLRYRMSADARSFADGANAVALPEPAPEPDKAAQTPAAPAVAEPAKAPASRPRSSIRPIQVR
jgi:type II secretion system protein D